MSANLTGICACCCVAIVFALGACSDSRPTVYFANLGFEEACADEPTGLCAWDVSYRVRSDIAIRDDDRVGRVLAIDNADGVGFVEQEARFNNPPEESILTFSALIRTEDVAGRGAGLNIGIYDADSALIQNVDMGYGGFSSATGTTDWRPYRISAVVTSDARRVRIGLINYGTGLAMFDSAAVAWEPLRGRRPSGFARDYVDVAIEHIRQNSLQRDSVDVASIRLKALQIAGEASAAEKAYPAIRYMLGALGDRHSFLMTARERALWQQDTGGRDITFSSARRIEQFGYVSVPGFHSDDARLKVAFADSLQRQLHRLYREGVRGWVVDLRENDGGNMAPMLAGLEPLFTADTLGFLIDVDGGREAWGRGEAIREAEGDDYVVTSETARFERRLPIAVLYGGRTGSSGEIVIISFIGDPAVRSFGVPSMGLTTGNGEFELPDGSYMYMASTRMADRTGAVFQGPVVPDSVVGADAEAIDAALDAALAWLRESSSP